MKRNKASTKLKNKSELEVKWRIMMITAKAEVLKHIEGVTMKDI